MNTKLASFKVMRMKLDNVFVFTDSLLNYVCVCLSRWNIFVKISFFLKIYLYFFGNFGKVIFCDILIYVYLNRRDLLFYQWNKEIGQFAELDKKKKKKKMINSASKTTDRSLCFWSAVRSLKDFYLTSCISFLMKMIYYHPTSEAFDPVNLA